MNIMSFLFKIGGIIYIIVVISYFPSFFKYKQVNNKYLYGMPKTNHLRINSNCTHEYYKIIKNPTEKERGKAKYICKLCGKKYYETFPRLTEKNYKVEELKSNCEHGNGKRYISSNNITYDATNNDIKLHSIYGEKCSYCNNLIGEFNFKKLGELKCLEYPRLFRLSDHWNNAWLLGGNGEDGKLYLQLSYNEGKNWTLPMVISHYPDHFCSNVAFYELPNHDIISAYQVVGHYMSIVPEIRHNRKIASSISRDGGKTWEKLGDIIDNFEFAQKLGKTKESAIKACEYENRIGFSDPFIEKINNKITVFYSDDFSIAFMQLIGETNDENYRAQNIYTQTFDIETKSWSSERNLIMDGTKKNRPTNSNLKKRIVRNGMPVVNTMKDGTYVLVFESNYRDKDYQLLTGKTLEEYHWYEILLSYSRDGITWSNPVEIYIPKNEGSTARAPYILSTEKNQLIISFQTDEDSCLYGFFSDYNSLGKIMISKPGIGIQDINKDSFYAITNFNNSPFGVKSVWNGMMLINNIIYACSSEETIKYSEIPLYEEDPNKYNDKLISEYEIKSGNISLYGNKIITKEEKTLLMNKNIDTTVNHTFYTYITPNKGDNETYDSGLIFGLNNPSFPFWKEVDHYMFIINIKGLLFIAKVINGVFIELQKKSDVIEYDFHNKNTYKMSVKFVPDTGEIVACINDNEIFNFTDKTLNGKNVGLRSRGNGTVFTQILAE